MADTEERTLSDLVVAAARDLPGGALESFCRALERLGAGATVQRIVGEVPVSNPEVARTLTALIETWRAELADAPFTSLAWALRGASATDDHWRQVSDLDLVWTGPAPALGKMRQTRPVLRSLIDCAQHDVWLICFAAYKVPLVVEALESALDRGVTVRIIHEDPEISQQKVKFSAIETLGQRVADAAELYIWPLEKRQTADNGAHGSLHAKAVLADNTRLFVSSANLTGHALDINMELGVLIRGGQRPVWMAEHLRWLVDSKTLERVS